MTIVRKRPMLLIAFVIFIYVNVNGGGSECVFRSHYEQRDGDVASTEGASKLW